MNHTEKQLCRLSAHLIVVAGYAGDAGLVKVAKHEIIVHVLHGCWQGSNDGPPQSKSHSGSVWKLGSRSRPDRPDQGGDGSGLGIAGISLRRTQRTADLRRVESWSQWPVLAVGAALFRFQVLPGSYHRPDGLRFRLQSSFDFSINKRRLAGCYPLTGSMRRRALFSLITNNTPFSISAG